MWEAHDGGTPRPRPRLAWGFWVVAAMLTAYVALTTGHRDELLGADAWEHHRAVRVLAELGRRPGNPTYATAEPSVRYSPYSVALALVARASGIDPFVLLGGAAALNTALLCVGLWAFARAYGRPEIALWTLGPL